MRRTSRLRQLDSALAARRSRATGGADLRRSTWAAGGQQQLVEKHDVILCESLCYPGIISLAHSMGRRLRGVAMDEHGLIPEALRAACQEHRPSLLVCVTTHQNPTNSVMPHARREAIAQIAREFDLFIVDDDIYGFLEPAPDYKPLAAYAPERSVYLTSLSKSVLPALRIGYLYAPPQTLSRLSSMVRSSVWMPPR